MTYCCGHGIDAKYKYCNIYICSYIKNIPLPSQNDYMFIYIYIYIYISHLLLRGFGDRLGKNRFTNQTNETSFSFRKILFISTGEIYFVFYSSKDELLSGAQ